MGAQISQNPKLYKSLFAWGLSKANSADESSIKLKDCNEYSSLGALKQALFANLQGNVLEIGPGAGVNLSYYPDNIHWIGIEPNSFMHQYIQQQAEHFGLQNIEIRTGSAEHLPVADNSIDTVVSTYVLCSVDNLMASLQEILRVLKPGGQFLFVEHVAAECGSWNCKLQSGIAPIWKVMFDGCHPNRQTWVALENANFKSVDYRRFQVSLPIVSPHIAGVAIKDN
jgi:ubiquinone/menaquinone biosynthesis C-methylase UbiE